MTTVPEQKPIIRERTSGRMFDVFESQEANNIYADGFSRLLLGPQVSRFDFYRLKAIKTEEAFPGVVIEDREAFCQIVIPTVALVELCGLVIEQMGANMSLMDTGHETLKAVIANAIQKASSIKS